MNFNYLLPGGGKGSRIFGGDHMVFRGTRGGQSSLTEYEGGTFRKLKANGGIIRKLQSVFLTQKISHKIIRTLYSVFLTQKISLDHRAPCKVLLFPSHIELVKFLQEYISPL